MVVTQHNLTCADSWSVNLINERVCVHKCLKNIGLKRHQNIRLCGSSYVFGSDFKTQKGRARRHRDKNRISGQGAASSWEHSAHGCSQRCANVRRCVFFLNSFLCLFIFERQRESTNGGGAEIEGDRIRSGLQAPSCQHRDRRGAELTDCVRL